MEWIRERVHATHLGDGLTVSYCLLFPKHLKFENSGTTNHIHIKLGPDMYHLNTFPLPRNEGVNRWAGEGACKKTKKTCHKNNKTSTLT